MVISVSFLISTIKLYCAFVVLYVFCDIVSCMSWLCNMVYCITTTDGMNLYAAFIWLFLIWGLVCEKQISRQHCQKLGKISTGLTYKLLLSFTVISDVYRCLFQTKLYLPSTVLLGGFQRELWNPLIKAVPGKFHGSRRHSKHNW